MAAKKSAATKKQAAAAAVKVKSGVKAGMNQKIQELTFN